MTTPCATLMGYVEGAYTADEATPVAALPPPASRSVREASEYAGLVLVARGDHHRPPTWLLTCDLCGKAQRVSLWPGEAYRRKRCLACARQYGAGGTAP
jgi:hypothetical protein